MKITKQTLLQFALLLVVAKAGVDLLGFLGIRQHIAKTVVPNQATVATANKDLNQTCSCLNSKATKECCIRFVHRLHKFGWVLSRKLFHDSGALRKKFSMTTMFDRHFTIFPASAADYRQVFMARNMYKAIVSGYLYHKGGQECSNSPYQRFGKSEWVKYTSHVTLPSWASKNHTLCSYLAATTEMEGLKLYIDIAFQKWYYNIAPFFHEVQRRKEKYNEDKTLVVCHDDLSHPDTKLATYNRIMDWMFPSGQNFAIPREIKAEERYQGDHATSHDPALRARLISLIKKLDRDVFYDKVASVQELLKCD